MSNADANQWLGSQWRDGQIDPRRVAFAINSKSHRFYVAGVAGVAGGLVAVSDIDPGDGVGMIWYLLGDRRLAGQGVMTSAVRLGVERAFNELLLEAVYAWIHPANVASLRILEKAGFQPAGRLRNAAVIGGERVDRVLLDLTRDDWRAMQR